MYKLHPVYKDAAKQIAENEQRFYPDNQLAEMLEEKKESDKYRFALMKLNMHLLDEYGIDFIRSENEDLGKGYKVATGTESIRISMHRLHRRVKNAARKQRKVLSIVDRSSLPESIKSEYDAHAIRGGLMLSFLSQTPLNKCLPGLVMRFDRPKLIEK